MDSTSGSCVTERIPQRIEIRLYSATFAAEPLEDAMSVSVVGRGIAAQSVTNKRVHGVAVALRRIGPELRECALRLLRRELPVQ